MKCAELKEFLSAYANNELSQLQREFVEEHLSGCADCRAILENYEGTRRQLETLQSMPVSTVVDTVSDTINKIQKIHHYKKPNLFRLFLIPQTRLAWLLLPLILILMGGAVYAATTGVKMLFESWAEDVEKKGLAQELNLSQTIDGITVNLERAYADSNVVLIGYSVNQPENQNYRYGATLATSDGQALDPMVGMIGAPEMERLGMSNSAAIFVYDASEITGNPTELNLVLKAGTFIFPGINGETTQPPGPLVFNFTVPFHAGKTIEVNQTIETAGIPITLERVVITTWATRADFNFYPHYDGPSAVSLKLPSGNSENATLGKNMGTPLLQRYFYRDFTNESGEWTIEIADLGSPPSQFGPWVFHFQVP